MRVLLTALLLLGGAMAAEAASVAAEGALRPENSTAQGRLNFCLSGWQSFRNKCYFLENNPASWSTAERRCEEREGSLASAHSLVEYDYLQRLARTGQNTFAWLGGYYFQDVWRWEDGSRFDFQHWESLASTSMYQCLFVNTEGTKGWSNHACHQFFPYICEMKTSC